MTWSTSDSRFSVRDNQLFLQSPLDYETETTIPLTLRATDTGFPTAFADLNVVIKITDENEAFPLLVGGTLAVDNGTPAGTLLRTLNAPDADSRQTVKYRLRSGDASAFSLDAVTGEL